MTTPDPQYKERVHRSAAAIAGGVLLLGIACWLGVDAIAAGKGSTPWRALAALLLVVPLVTAFTLRPAVFVGQDRLRVRNPFRIIVLPWGQIETLRSGYSNEALTKSGAKFQLWAIPVSLRARNKAARREARRVAQGGGPLGVGSGARAVPDGPVRAESDRAMDELRELLEARGAEESAQGEIVVRWAYEVVGPAVAGAVLLGILLVVG
ncbi:integral membrane protein [Streptomyces lincolnensis]|uniref:Integral membrane protein n=1 Tax=Streptomyces lincolnensis TaxID=1915 RepID=A0A1B1MGK3_STRLN|nr:PH domain-containing protein [Streptomyces lincolnensis]ANS67522.1 integral membrane protein [Streptomyces lincolnensis]AXG54837.1 integral membrane protein [Streptomyces lincolnensis]QMV09189.1 PH domain-containing protein [Streptomyces lincolnensis]